MSLHEPLISDHLLREGWYRTDDHHIPTIGNGATINSCGSSYPIVVKGKSLHRKSLWCCHILTDKGCGRQTDRKSPKNVYSVMEVVSVAVKVVPCYDIKLIRQE